MKFLKKKEVCGSHKQYTGHTKNSTTATKRTSKKKETNKQTQTRDNRYPNGYPIFSVVGSWLPLSSQIQFWTLNLTFIYKIFFFFLIYLWETNTHIHKGERNEF